MHKVNRRKGRGERGQTMTEFVIVLPIFLLLLLGIAQLGIAFNHYIQLTDATRAGARFGAPLDCSGTCDRTNKVVTKVKASAANLNAAQVSVGSLPPGSRARISRSVRATRTRSTSSAWSFPAATSTRAQRSVWNEEALRILEVGRRPDARVARRLGCGDVCRRRLRNGRRLLDASPPRHPGRRGCVGSGGRAEAAGVSGSMPRRLSRTTRRRTGAVSPRIQFSSNTFTNDTVSVRADRTAPGFLSKVLGIASVDVSATAKARAFNMPRRSMRRLLP